MRKGQFTDAQKKDICAKVKTMIKNGYTVYQASKELGLKGSMLYRWGIKAPKKNRKYKTRITYELDERKSKIDQDVETCKTTIIDQVREQLDRRNETISSMEKEINRLVRENIALKNLNTKILFERYNLN